MILASALTAAAICGGINFYLNDKYSDDAINRNGAAVWGVWGTTASFVAAAIVVGAFQGAA